MDNMYWSERGLTAYSHPYYDMNGVWDRHAKRASFWFPLELNHLAEATEKFALIADAIGMSPESAYEAQIINPNFTLDSYPSENNESGKRLVVISSILDFRFSNQQHKEISAMNVEIGKGSMTYEQAYVYTAMGHIGVRATQLMSLYEPYMLKNQPELT